MIKVHTYTIFRNIITGLISDKVNAVPPQAIRWILRLKNPFHCPKTSNNVCLLIL